MKTVSFCLQGRIIGHPRNPYTPVTREDDKLASVLSKPRSSTLADPRQRQNSLHKEGLRHLCVILILELVTIGQAELDYRHHQPFKWTLARWEDQHVIKENVTAGAPSFAVALCSMISILPCLNKMPYYLCPASNPGKGYCNYPNQYYCAYWDCVTIASAWTPTPRDKYLTTTWGPRGCKPPQLDPFGAISEKHQGDCSHVILQIAQPEDPGWLLGKTWGVRYWEPGTDRGGLILIKKEVLQRPQAIGPNPVLNPQTSRPLIHDAKNNTEDVAPSNTKTLNTLEFEMPPLWKLLNSTYQILNSTNPNMTTNCWLCYDTKPPFYEAVGIPSDPKLVNGSNPTQCVWNTANNPGITMQYVSGQGTCVGEIPLEKKRLCINEIILGKGSKSDWLVPANNTKWICSKTGVTPCISLKQFNGSGEFCIQIMIIPRIIYHPEEFIYNYQTLLTSHHIQKREPFTALTIATLLALGTAGAGTGIASLVEQNQKFHSLRITVDEDLARIEQSISALETSLRSLSEVVLQNRRGLDLMFLQRGGVCAALGEECCVYADNTGVVRDTMAKLREGLEKRKRDREAQQWWFESWFNRSPWLTTLISSLIGPIAIIMMALIFGPCILNRIVLFVKSRLEKVNIMLVEHQQLL